MPNQINITFKSNDVEQALYYWLKSKLNTGGYIKETLYKKYLEETQSTQQMVNSQSSN